MYTKEKFTIHGDRLSQSGVNYGYGDSNPYLIARGDRHAIVKQKGVTDWCSRGSSGYYPAEWFLVEVKFSGNSMMVTKILMSKEPGHQWCSYKKKLLAKMKELEKK